jgi:transposase-like protein
MISTLEKENTKVFCPLCSNEINQIWTVKYEFCTHIRFLYFCKNCQKIVNISKENIDPLNHISLS